MATVELRAANMSDASVERIWALLADLDGWASWGAWDTVTVDEPGDDAGVGAVRTLVFERTRSREEVIAVEAPHSLSYKLLSGIPIREYTATVTLTPTDDGTTEIEWRCSYRNRIPLVGPKIRKTLHDFLQNTVERLGRAAEQTPA